MVERLVDRLTAPLSDAVIACSETTRRRVIEAHGLRPGVVRTLRNGVELSAPPPDPAARDRLRRDLGAGPDDPLIGTLGGLDAPTQGLSIFLAAARLVAAELPRARFAIVGAGPARASLEARAAREGVSHRTAFAGARRDVPSVMRALDLFVQPSLWEGYDVTLLEAMAAGTPVVAGRFGDVPEIVQDGATGILVAPGDPMALARGCAALLRDRVLSSLLARSGRARVETSFRVEELVDRTASMYRELLGLRRGGPCRQPLS
jgi:glycosyltransferase involved in cell wall biosynthesis